MNGAGEPIGLNWAAPQTPGRVSLDRIPVRPGACPFHSHLTDSPLSRDDLAALSLLSGRAITAVTPAGSIWRVVRKEGADLAPMLDRFSAATMGLFRSELQAIGPDAQQVYNHARMRWLEKEGAIAYSWRMSGAARQVMDAH